MAAGAFTLYSNAFLGITKKLFDLNADTYVMTLHTNSYTPAANTDTLWSSVSASELSTAGGYTAGGFTLTRTCTLTSATVTFTCSPSPSWATFTAGPFRYGVITHRAAGALVAGDLLLCYSDLGGGTTITGTGGTFTVTIDALGILTFTHSP